MKMSPFHLVYGGDTLIPIEVNVGSTQVQAYDFDNPDRRLLELDLINKMREMATMQLFAY